MAANRLAGSTSPDLLALQNSPIDWYPWGEEALLRAREENKPIFLSVGYSTCYWCRVMARESCFDDGLAELLNRHFISIKVDREERPDVDEIYMAATQVLTHGGGWPNTVFLMPDLRPWFCGTYFAPEDRGEQPGFLRVVHSMIHAWEKRRNDVRAQALELDAVLKSFLEDRGAPAQEPPGTKVVEAAFERLRSIFDEEHGGFGEAAKFPMPANLFLLEDLAAEPASETATEAARMLDRTLDRMARGGIFDHISGGFHRHATDRAWLIPHFEKLLADNGLLLEIYARHHARTGSPQSARVVRRIAAFLDEHLGLEEGGFATATAALGGEDERPDHVWALPELVGALGEEDAGFLAPIFGYDRPPFFEESHYVLHLPLSLEEQARRRRMQPEELEAQVAPLLEKLREANARRRREPIVDDKVLTDANGMAIAGLATAGRLLGDSEIIERAVRAADFVLGNLCRGVTLSHVWRDGKARFGGFLVDYVHLVRGLLALHEATGEKYFLTTARDLTRAQVDRLGDPRGGFYTAEPSPELRWRSKEIFDSGLPSANAFAVLNLLDLAERDDDPSWRELAEVSLRAFAVMAERGEGVRMLALAVRRWHRFQA